MLGHPRPAPVTPRVNFVPLFTVLCDRRPAPVTLEVDFVPLFLVLEDFLKKGVTRRARGKVHVTRPLVTSVATSSC